MTERSKPQATKSERTLLTALLLSAPGPIVTGVSFLTSFSATQMADFLRRTTELVAVIASWLIFRKLQLGRVDDAAGKTRLERLVNLWVGGTMACSGIVMLLIAVIRLTSYTANGNVAMGLVIAALGLLTNTWFYFRYRSLARVEFNAVVAAQQKLYRAKSCVDLVVVVALAAVAIAPTHPAIRYVDISGSALVAIYLLWNGYTALRK